MWMLRNFFVSYQYLKSKMRILKQRKNLFLKDFFFYVETLVNYTLKCEILILNYIEISKTILNIVFFRPNAKTQVVEILIYSHIHYAHNSIKH